MKKAILFSAIALTASVFADGDMIAAQMRSDAQSMNQAKSLNAVTLASAAPTSDNGWYLFGDALYWHASVGNADWSIRNNDINVSTPTSYTNHKLDFKWDWGFRVGLGVNMDYDQWDSNISYTWFRTKNSNEIGTTAVQRAYSTDGTITNSPFAYAQNKWKIHFSMFDWELARAFFVSKNLSLRPHVGVKGGWIHQTIDEKATYGASGTTTNATQFKNKFWGVGPSAGVNTTWALGNVDTHHFSLFGDVAGALMYGHFDVDYSAIQTTIATGDVANGSQKLNGLDRNLAVPMLQSMMGLSWDTGFNNDGCHFSLRVGYEFQYWFRQNQTLKLEQSITNGYTRASDDLALQGLTVDFRFDF